MKTLTPITTRSLFRNPSPSTTLRSFSTTSPRPASPLFALASLSNSRETAHFTKLSSLSRVAHSPNLQLIKSSEVDPFVKPAPPVPTKASPVAVRLPVQVKKVASSLSPNDVRAISVGRAVLSQHAREVRGLRRAMQKCKFRSQQRTLLTRQEKKAWEQERRKLKGEVRGAGIWILGLIGVATALAMGKTLPGVSSQAGAVDSGEMGRRIAEKARRAMSVTPVPAVVIGGGAAQKVGGVAAPSQSVVTASQTPTVAAAAAAAPASTVMTVAPAQQASSWRGLFWKQA